jgi:hypothetical protein
MTSGTVAGSNPLAPTLVVQMLELLCFHFQLFGV